MIKYNTEDGDELNLVEIRDLKVGDIVAYNFKGVINTQDEMVYRVSVYNKITSIVIASHSIMIITFDNDKTTSTSPYSTAMVLV